MDNTVKINKAIKLVAQISIDKASQVLSKLVKTGARIEIQNAFVTDLSSVTSRVSKENAEIVGALIDLVGDAKFKFLFFVKLQDSFLLADLMLRRDPGTTTDLDIFATSAVQEVGNILASSISGVFASDFGINLRPTPPLVINDFAGAVFQEFIVSSVAQKNEVMMIESRFNVVKNDINCHMFILPMGDSEKILSYIANTM